MTPHSKIDINKRERMSIIKKIYYYNIKNKICIQCKVKKTFNSKYCTKCSENLYYSSNLTKCKDSRPIIDAMLIRQKSLCAICLKEMKIMTIDHDHKTGIVRGLLCKNCNLALGHFKDDIKCLKKAIRYINNSRKELSTGKVYTQTKRTGV